MTSKQNKEESKMKKVFAVALAIVLALSLFVGCSETKAEAPTASVTEQTFDLSDPQDVTFTVDLHGEELSSLKSGGSDVSADSYTLSGNTLTLKKELFTDRTKGTVVEFALATAGGTLTLKVTVSDAAPAEVPQLGGAQNYDLTAKADVVFALDLKGASLTAVKNGTASLDSGDYAFDASAKTLTIKQAYLDTLTLKAGDEITITVVTSVKELQTKIVVVATNGPVSSEPSAEFFLDEPADVTVSVDTKGLPLTAVLLEGDELTEDDYSFTDGTLTIKADFLSVFAPGDLEFTLSTGAASATFTVVVKYAAIQIDGAPFAYVGAGEDVAIALDLGGSSLESVALGAETLTAEEDYSLSGSELTLNSSFLETLEAPSVQALQLKNSRNKVTEFLLYSGMTYCTGFEFGDYDLVWTDENSPYGHGAGKPTSAEGEVIAGEYSLKLTSAGGVQNVLAWLDGEGYTLDKSVNYHIEFTFRVLEQSDENALFFVRMNGNPAELTNGLIVNSDMTFSGDGISPNVQAEGDQGVYRASVTLPTTDTSTHFDIVTTAAATVILDDVQVYTVAKPAPTNYAVVASDIYSKTAQNDVQIELNTTPAADAKVYEPDGSTQITTTVSGNSLVISHEYLATLENGVYWLQLEPAAGVSRVPVCLRVEENPAVYEDVIYFSNFEHGSQENFLTDGGKIGHGTGSITTETSEVIAGSGSLKVEVAGGYPTVNNLLAVIAGDGYLISLDNGYQYTLTFQIKFVGDPQDNLFLIQGGSTNVQWVNKDWQAYGDDLGEMLVGASCTEAGDGVYTVSVTWTGGVSFEGFSIVSFAPGTFYLDDVCFYRTALN